MRPIGIRVHKAFLLVSLVFTLNGCSQKDEADVTGKVTYNGKLLDKPDGQIVFVAPDGTQVKASIGLDGAYRASKVPVGLNRVAVFYPNPEFKVGRTLPIKGKAPLRPSVPVQPYLTPVKYSAVDDSNLSVQVERGSVFNVEMKGPPIR